MKIVKVVIPCRNEKNYIERCLQSLIDCDYPKSHLKVIVADGVSDDGTTEIIEKIARENNFISIKKNNKKTTPFALNIGLKEIDYDIGIILGAHSSVHSDFIKKCCETFDKVKDAYCVGGFIINKFENDISRIISVAMSSPFGVGNAHFRTGIRSGYVDTVAFGAYKKEVFEKIGFFDEELVRNQDDEFNFRMAKSGMKIWLSEEIKSDYYVRASFSKLFRQYFQYGYWKVFVNRKHHVITTIRQLAPPAWILFLFLGWIPGIFFLPLLWIYVSVAGLYFFLAFFIAFLKSDPKNDFFKLFFTFMILHFSYGTGYLKGILHFYILRKNPIENSMKLSR